MTLSIQLDKLLMRVEKPGRYIGGELNTVKKDLSNIRTRFGFAFPDTYEIGMSYLGLQIIYHILNKVDSVYCERIFAPAEDMESLLRAEGLPLFTLETKSPIRDLDILGFTLQYELSYSNIVNMLNLGGIPYKSKDRDASYPFIAAGGPCAFNSEPLAEILDFIMVGDGEEVLPQICEAHKSWKESGSDKETFLRTLAEIDGVYVPKFYTPVYNDDGKIIEIKKNYDKAPDRVEKRILDDLDLAEFPEKTIVPLIEAVHDRAVIEIFRGCTRGCRFCQAGIIYRPVRERTKETIKNMALNQLAETGHEELSLLSLSTSDHSQIEPLVEELMAICKENNVSLSLPSLRLDSFSFKVLQDIQGYKKSGLTFAPEAGSQRLRDVINKTITDDDIYNGMEQAIRLGWTSIKLYFMIGLPTETYEDLDGIVEIAKNITAINYNVTGKRGRFNLSVSVSNFVPKAHTPFQWVPQDTADTFHKKHQYLRDKLKSIKGVSFNYHGTDPSHLEAVFARGDRRLCDTLIKAVELGCKFDGWREHLKYDIWMKAFLETGIDPDFYAHRERSYDEILPWDIIDTGVTKEFLIAENNKSLREEQSSDCRLSCIGCGINSRVECTMEGIK
ncbi:MAG: TIGR03960 family B12-binding radical SAM protein [Eubacteriales bacterium]|nr:TIGR03960 family B12-binding radical SAM protein [Eubacteriales bacterium]MDD3199560.1 TIGR03960 family B12-binding radical SAM protein [Eubacteriales bacterium]MDD4122099.1 TIGR03960 family B12-binding radical SAM protein [Eubacteriales bacterium]MDD4629833.1 TIGR03960 family B12-binding radical SAM protein [Eubacteriales bacterium]